MGYRLLEVAYRYVVWRCLQEEVLVIGMVTDLLLVLFWSLLGFPLCGVTCLNLSKPILCTVGIDLGEASCIAPFGRGGS